MQSIVPDFKRKMNQNKRRFKVFLTKLEKFKIPEIEIIRTNADAQAWKEIDCLTCGNCCRSMTPTFTEEDLLRIAPHFNMTVDAFKTKWLKYEPKDKDWVNKKQPCQFLNLNDNKCSIYEIRPDDCAKFPHHLKKDMDDYIDVYKQNIMYCPATYKWTEIMKTEVESKYELYK